MPLFEYCDSFRKEGDRVDRFPTPKFAEHAKEREAHNPKKDEVAWGDLADIFGKVEKSPVVKLRDGVTKPGQKKMPWAKKEAVVEQVSEELQITEEQANTRWYAPATKFSATPMPAPKVSEADKKMEEAKARLKVVEDRLKAAQEKLNKKTEDVAEPAPKIEKIETELKQPEEPKPTVVETSDQSTVDDCAHVEEVQAKPEEATTLTSKSESMDLSSYAPHCVLIFISLFVQRVLEPADASMLTFGSWLQCTGLLALLASIIASASVEGLRVSTFERLGAAAFLRLVVAGAGYFPAGEFEDLYLLGDAGTLVVSIGILTLMRTVYKSTCVANIDSYDRGSVALMCIGFACAVHGDLSDSVVLDIVWMTALCADSVALLPQVEAMVRGCKSMPMTSVAAMIASRACVFAFWFEASAELRIVVAAVVMASQASQLLLACSLVTGRLLALVKRDVSAELSSELEAIRL